MNYKAEELSTSLLEDQVKQLEESLRFCMQRDRPAVREVLSEYKNELKKRAALADAKEGA